VQLYRKTARPFARAQLAAQRMARDGRSGGTTDYRRASGLLHRERSSDGFRHVDPKNENVTGLRRRADELVSHGVTGAGRGAQNRNRRWQDRVLRTADRDRGDQGLTTKTPRRESSIPSPFRPWCPGGEAFP